MKFLLFALSPALVAISVGCEQRKVSVADRGSQVASEGRPNTSLLRLETVISEIRAEIKEETISLSISGELGTNQCAAEGTRLQAEYGVRDGRMAVTLFRVMTKEASERTCTAEHLPIMGTVTQEVQLRDAAQLRNYQSMGNTVEVADVAVSSLDMEAVIDNLKIRKLQSTAGSKLEKFEIKGSVKLGFNSCAAKGVKAELRQSIVGNKLVVRAMLMLPPDLANRVCNQQREDVRSNVRLVVSIDRAKTKEAVVRDAGASGNEIKIK